MAYRHRGSYWLQSPWKTQLQFGSISCLTFQLLICHTLDESINQFPTNSYQFGLLGHAHLPFLSPVQISPPAQLTVFSTTACHPSIKVRSFTWRHSRAPWVIISSHQPNSQVFVITKVCRERLNTLPAPSLWEPYQPQHTLTLRSSQQAASH